MFLKCQCLHSREKKKPSSLILRFKDRGPGKSSENGGITVLPTLKYITAWIWFHFRSGVFSDAKHTPISSALEG